MLKARSQAKEIEMAPGVVRRTLNHGEKMLLTEVTIAAGYIVPWHSHPHEQIGYLASGRLLFEIGDDEKREIEAGDSWLVPSNALHKVTAIIPSVAIDIFSPVREDYMD